MKKISIAVAYPTIPIIFLGGINSDRTPLYDTMGLAVTSLNESTRTETSIEIINNNVKGNPNIDFYLGEKKISGLRGEQIIASIKSFMKNNNLAADIEIHSVNYEIFSGSSDSGLAALFTALNDVFSLNYSNDELLKYSMKGSESAGRSLIGGLTLTQVSKKPLTVTQLASEEVLKSIKLFSIPFLYNTRFSADEIHSGIVTNPLFNERKQMIPIWISKIKEAIEKSSYLQLLEIAEENIRNAHELLEGVGLAVRKPKMLELCKDIEKIRNKGIYCYYLIGGGNLVTVATIDQYAKDVSLFLKKKGWKFYDFKVASAPKIVSKVERNDNFTE
ncbi:MAG: hypothetical protein EAX90_03920 [Candidatus Heimdallarchaeota archaeon]|nr:hypothetical protein [Candidatus Heimdallarchaeota archaeon]